ncbi:type 1 glutamine amidotransferase domain-containing protein [Corynebacterium dentalis]|uniref:type 1 glutamine amidotransferase domain-containing protein n=1 Tax=Corynebacterium dentalis TaxID=2014528 RepID=UPI000C08A0DB|nr:type 1 glutamine amidotransferase domain-containing protein [Corynebacterium dentalis]
MTKILIALTAADHWTLKDGTEHPTGFWAEEFVVPHDIFSDAGYEITIATPGGKTPVVDQLSLKVSGGVLPSTAKKMKERLEELKPALENAADLHELSADDFDGVFYPGGHGPMEDLSVDKASGKILIDQLASGGQLGLLCHSPAALLATVDEQGNTPFAGRKVTGLSNVEERINPFGWKAKWYLEDKLKEAGLSYSKGFPLRSNVVQDGNLYTGQNPQSSKELAELMVATRNLG